MQDETPPWDDGNPPRTLAASFHELFRGADRSHGTYTAEDPEPGGKRTIKRTARTLREPITEHHWAEHLAGRRPLGVVPIREDDHCWWGAVDVDDYTADASAMAGDLLAAGIPAICCKTKSGGIHVYLFFSEAIPATEVVPRLRELAARIGHADSEIFPKQTTVLANRGDLGSWLNMPYFEGDKTERYAIRPDGRGLSMDGFLTRALAVRLTRRGLADLELNRTVQGFESGPPCLESLVATGFPEHTRNNGILALGILAKKLSPDGWEKVLEGWVKEYGGTPAFPNSELNGIIKSLRRKDYNYKCSDKPLNMRCNVAVCRTRPHGVGGGQGAVSILESLKILQTDPPLFFLVLKDGTTVELSAQQLLNPGSFQHAVLVQRYEVVPEYKRNDWVRWVRDVVQKATHIEVPKESGTGGKFEELLEQFLTDRYRAESRDEIITGKSWYDEETDSVCFRLRDLEAELDRAKFTCPQAGASLRGWLTARIREMNGWTAQIKVAGRNINVWWLRASNLTWITTPLNLPRVEEGPI